MTDESSRFTSHNEQIAEVPASEFLLPRWVDFTPPHNDGRLETEKHYSGWHIGLCTDMGLDKRTKNTITPGEHTNQDFIAAEHVIIPDTNIDDVLLILVDGMGGQGDGFKAAQTTVEVISDQYKILRRSLPRKSALMKAVEEANKAVLEFDDASDATIAIVAASSDGSYTAIHLGDARVYYITPDKAKHIGKDHSEVQGEIDKGSLKPEDVYSYGRKNIVLRGIGDKNLNLNDCVSEGQVQEGDQMLVCSDGLWEMTKDADGKVIHIFARSATNQAEVARRLVAFANQQGGKDNIGLVIATYKGPQQVQPQSQPNVQISTEPQPLHTSPTPSHEENLNRDWEINSISAATGKVTLHSIDNQQISLPVQDCLTRFPYLYEQVVSTLVSGTDSFGTLIQLVNNLGSIHGSSDNLDASDLTHLLNYLQNGQEIVNGKKIIDYITRTAGLRTKVEELIKLQKQQSTQQVKEQALSPEVQLRTFLQKGFSLMKQGKYLEADKYFQDIDMAKIVGCDLSLHAIIINTDLDKGEYLQRMISNIYGQASFIPKGVPRFPLNLIYVVGLNGSKEIPDHILYNVSLSKAEQWIHVLQYLNGNRPLVEGYTDRNKDVAAFLLSQGVTLTEEFLNRYGRKQAFPPKLR